MSSAQLAATPPHLTFACELDPARLTSLFADGSVIEHVQALQAHVALALADLSVERADVVRRLNAARIPVIAIPLLSLEEGYYFTPENSERAVARYAEWKSWTARQELEWAGVGLDIEPEARFYLQIMNNPWGLPRLLLPRLRDTQRPRRAREAYAALIDQIRVDGYAVENYQFPLIADERWAGSTLLQRLFGLVDVATDREVWMLYTSVMPGDVGPGLLWTYAPEAPAIGVGSTGGGPDIPGHPQVAALKWEAFSRDLRLAHRWCDTLYVHSLEGCVWQGFLPRLRSFDWQQSVTAPGAGIGRGLRGALRGILWSDAHPRQIAAAGLALGFLFPFIRAAAHRRRFHHR